MLYALLFGNIKYVFMLLINTEIRFINTKTKVLWVEYDSF